MRLTLRTLLAYLDGVLEPADRDDLHEQIEASDFARDLIHRTRDVSRRLRLVTPEPLGQGPIDDPNTMAEYLDNTLPAESVPEFERHCLESDVILAEAAASHHVLAMVLGRPAEVDPETRDRVHALPDALREAERLRVDAAHQAQQGASAASSGAVRHESSEALPDYLRESQRDGVMRWMPAIAALLLLCATAYLTFFQSGAEPEPVAAVDTQSDDVDRKGPKGEPVAETVDTDPEPVEKDSPAEAATDAEYGSLSIGVESDTEATADGETDVEAPTAPVNEAAAPETGDADTEIEIEPPPTQDPAPDPTGPDDVDVVDPSVEPAMSEAETSSSPAEQPLEPPAPAYTEAGTFVGPASSLVAIEADPDAWYRLAGETPIGFDSRIMALPSYRGEVDLANGLVLKLLGHTEVFFPRSEEEGTSLAVELRYGRMVVTNPGEQAIALRLVVDGDVSQVELFPKGSVAVETDHPYRGGFDVLNASPPSATRVFAPGGGLTWEHDGLRLEIDAAKQWELAPGGRIVAFTSYEGDPGLIEALRLSPWDEQASPLLAGAVVEGREVWPQLREVVDGDEFKEVRALAARCGAAVSHPDPLTASFSDEAQRPVWSDNLAELRRLASRSTIEAERVRRSLVERHGERLAADLFRMIRGFGEGQQGANREEVQREALALILDWLGSESLASRVLANLNLEELTGRQGVFRPTDSPIKRRQALRRLRKWFNDNELRVASLGG